MNVSGINVKQVLFQNENNTSEIIRKIYPDIRSSFFFEKPNVYDKNYITGSIRALSEFKKDGYFVKKNAINSDIREKYSEYQTDLACISPSDANTQKGSWETVISGKRPMGQFSVDSLYSPELHAILDLPNIGCKIFPKEDNEFLYIIVIYRKDSENGEKYANRYIELYNQKRDLMNSMEGENHMSKVIKSELIIAKEMGLIFSYSQEEIDNYMHKLSSSVQN